MFRALWWSWGGWLFLIGEVPLYPQAKISDVGLADLAPPSHAPPVKLPPDVSLSHARALSLSLSLPPSLALSLSLSLSLFRLADYS